MKYTMYFIAFFIFVEINSELWTSFFQDRVYYCSESLMKKAACVAREQLLSFGTCLGKFTKTKKFHIHITALDYIAPYAKALFLTILLINLICY